MTDGSRLMNYHFVEISLRAAITAGAPSIRAFMEMGVRHAHDQCSYQDIWLKRTLQSTYKPTTPEYGCTRRIIAVWSELFRGLQSQIKRPKQLK